MTAAARYYVGIGVQRSGTTWLGDYLAAHPQAGLVPFKECHYWTAKFTRHERYIYLTRRFFLNRFPRLLRHARRPGEPLLPFMAGYAGMMMHQDASYRRLLDLSGRGAAITGEITPSYATLPEAGIRAIETCLDRPRYILLLRNPADRFVSQIAHTAHYDPSVLTADPVGDLAQRPYFAVRSDYAGCLSTWRAAVDPERLLVEFHETLFDPARAQAACDRITDFLGIDRRPGPTGQRANQRRVRAPLVDRPALVRHLRPHYDAVAALYPDDLPQSWWDDMQAAGVAP